MKNTKEKIKLKGWQTTDEKEIEKRKIRGKKDFIQIRSIEPNFPVFGTYIASSHSNIDYIVEIRSLNELKNSCSCPDFQTNSLYTCKHIEKILFTIKNKLKSNETNSFRVEIFLKSKNIYIQWPENIDKNSKIFNALDPLFSSNGKVLSDPISAMDAIERIINSDPQINEKVRISRMITNFLTKIKKIEAKKIAKKQFLEDVKQKKRSLHFLKYPLYPYQEEGMLHLAFTAKAILADDMGLGKTIQAIGACDILKRVEKIQRVLVISPASLKTEWEEQIKKFTNFPSLIIQGPRHIRLKMFRQKSFFYLTNYEQIRGDFEDIQNILSPDVIILDEAQRIKNWQTKTAWSVKQLKSDHVFILTGTPIENKIDEIYSICQMIDQTIFGSLFRFNRNFYELDEYGRPKNYKNLDILHKTLKPFLLRRTKIEVEKELPKRTINNYFVKMEEEQTNRYEEYSLKVARLLKFAEKRILTKEELEMLQRNLSCMRMICDTPYILDEECNICPKLKELKIILKELLSNDQNKIIIFSEWARMLKLIQNLLDSMKIKYVLHSGSVSQQNRRLAINNFKNDSKCIIFLSTDSGSTGLNLQNANIVINMDLPWNPAKLEQRIARSWRKNQKRTVQVINFISENTIEHRMLSILSQKQKIANAVLEDTKIKQMPITSGKAAFLERLENLINFKIHKKETVFSLKNNFKNDMKAHFHENLHLLEIYKDKEGKNTIFAVMEKVDKNIENKTQNLIQNNYKSSVKLNLLDKKTFSIIQNLLDSGILKIGEKETLIGKSLSSQNQFDEKKEKIKKAQKNLLEIQRKMKMSLVLSYGGFPIEALEPAKEVLKKGAKLILDIENNELIKKEEEILFNQINKKDILETQASNIINSIKLFLEKIENTLNKHALSL